MKINIKTQNKHKNSSETAMVKTHLECMKKITYYLKVFGLRIPNF